MFHNYDTPQSKSAVRGVICDGQRLRAGRVALVLLSQVVALNKNEMKNISQLPLFIHPGDSEFISQEILRF